MSEDSATVTQTTVTPQTTPESATTQGAAGADASAPRATRGRPSRRWARLGVLSSLLAVLVIAAGMVLIRDAAVAFGLAEGSLWTVEALEWLDGATREAAWVWVAAVLALLLGLWFLGWAFVAPRQSLVPVPGRSGLYVRYSGVERLATGAARDVSGVERCSAEASSRRVVVRVRTTGGTGAGGEVRDSVRDALGPLSDRLSVRVISKGLDE